MPHGSLMQLNALLVALNAHTQSHYSHLVRVTEAAERLADGLESLVRTRGLVLVWVQLQCQLAVCLLDVIVVSGFGKAEDGVEVVPRPDDVAHQGALLRSALCMQKRGHGQDSRVP